MGSRRWVGAALAVLCLGSILVACAPQKPPPPPPELRPPPPDQPLPPGSPTLSTETNFVTGLNNPWDIAFVPGDANRFFYTQRPGPVRFRVVSPLSDNLIVMPADVAAAGEAGMMGLAADPDFANNRFIYTCYTTANDNRVVRFQVNATFNGIDTSTVLASGWARANFHDGCRVRFGPDGKLWVTTGDGGVGTAPQSLDSLNGKVLRINSDGSAPGDNPFVGRPGDDRIYTFGHRNPQGIAFRPVNNAAYSIEHGPDKNDEVNALAAGGNGGWDPVPGYNQTVPMTDLEKFPDAMIPAWRSGDDGTVAPSGGTFLTGSQWEAWENQLVVAFLRDSRARVMFLDGNGNVSFASPILANGVRLRSVVQGPDGLLYVTTDVGGGNGAIWKVTPG